MKNLLDLEIEKLEKEYLACPKTSRVEDNLNKMYIEGLLEGLCRAKRLINKQSKLSNQN